MKVSQDYDYGYIQQLQAQSRQLEQLLKQQKNANGTEAAPASSTAGVKKKRDRYCPTPCPYCELVLTRKDGLPRHIENRHPQYYTEWRANRTKNVGTSGKYHF